MNRTLPFLTACALVLAALPAMAQPQYRGAVISTYQEDPMGCATLVGPTTRARAVVKPITDNGVTRDTISVTGVPPGVLWFTRVTLNITHTDNAELDITLTNPDGRIVTLTTDNGGTNDNGFAGSLFNDDADPDGQAPYVTNANMVTDHPYVNLVPATPLTPEEPLFAFAGSTNINGDWILTISDDTAADLGTLNGWTLEFDQLTSIPSQTPVTRDVTPGDSISAAGTPVVRDTVNVTGVGNFLLGFDATSGVRLNITHTFPGDLDITLTSPMGTHVTLTTDNGGTFDHVFAGTTFNNFADMLDGQVPYTTNAGMVTDHPYVALTVATPLTPEEPLSAFYGENPNGDWILSVSDDANADGGRLVGWGFTFLTSCVVVPVELTSFEATTSGRDVTLAWETASETNNAGFEVEMRAIPSETWSAVGFVEGHGTTTEAQTYTYAVRDLTPGRYAFRLRQVDYDGAFEYSQMVEATIGVPGSHFLTQAYPNPFNPQATFTLALAQAQRVTIALYDVLGREVMRLHDGPLAADQTHAFTIDGATLPSGLYVYRVAGETFTDGGSVTLVK